MSRNPLWCIVLSVALLLPACATKRALKSSVLDFLYPQGTDAIPATDVNLKVPARVGVAFAPGAQYRYETFSETKKQELLTRIAASFTDHESIASVEAVPSSFLSPKGSFENLDRLAVAFGVDLMALISYDQIQFSETGRSSWAYWTLVGAYLVKGEKNETRTMLDLVVYDIPSRAMLFHTSGRSSSTGKSTPIDVTKELRERSEEGFDSATDDLIDNTRVALEAFEKQVAQGTVRGPGTPAVAIQDISGGPAGSGGGSGAGAFGPPELLAAALLIALGVIGWRKRDA